MKALRVIDGDKKETGRAPDHDGIADAVAAARRAGFCPGRSVILGTVPGTIVGYNIAGYGAFSGLLYPLLVATGLGVAKCHPIELRLVRTQEP
jgi:hypothetical protein